MDNNAQDSSGNGNNGTVGGGATYDTAGRIGAALSLDGIDDYVDCGNGASLNITDTITLAVWIKPSDVGNGQYNDYLGKSDHSYAIKHNNNNVFEFVVYDGAWYGATLPVTSEAYNGAWHHLAGTYDGTQVKLYVDGRVVASTLRTGAIAPTTYNVNIGRNSELTDRLYYGLIDDARIYHGVLPTSEILKLANP
jgi:beta-galactosidase